MRLITPFAFLGALTITLFLHGGIVTMANHYERRAAKALVIVSSTYASQEPREVTVGFSDLNLKRDTGVHAAYRRVIAAAHEVCAQSGDQRTWSSQIARRHCLDAGVAKAIEDFDHPMLTAYARTSTGGGSPDG